MATPARAGLTPERHMASHRATPSPMCRGSHQIPARTSTATSTSSPAARASAPGSTPRL